MDGEEFNSVKKALDYLKDKYEADSVYYKLIETFDVSRLEEIISKMQDRNNAEGDDSGVINMYEVITRIIAIQSVANVAKISEYDRGSDYYSIPSFTIFDGIQQAKNDRRKFVDPHNTSRGLAFKLYSNNDFAELKNLVFASNGESIGVIGECSIVKQLALFSGLVAANSLGGDIIGSNSIIINTVSVGVQEAEQKNTYTTYWKEQKVENDADISVQEEKLIPGDSVYFATAPEKDLMGAGADFLYSGEHAVYAGKFCELLNKDSEKCTVVSQYAAFDAALDGDNPYVPYWNTKKMKEVLAFGYFNEFNKIPPAGFPRLEEHNQLKIDTQE